MDLYIISNGLNLQNQFYYLVVLNLLNCKQLDFFRISLFSSAEERRPQERLGKGGERHGNMKRKGDEKGREGSGGNEEERKERK